MTSLSKQLWTKICRTGKIEPGEGQFRTKESRQRDGHEGLLVAEKRSIRT